MGAHFNGVKATFTFGVNTRVRVNDGRDLQPTANC